MCEARGLPVERIGVVDEGSTSVEVQGQFTVCLEELRSTSEGVLPGLFGWSAGGTEPLSGESPRRNPRTPTARTAPSPSGPGRRSLVRLDFGGVAFAALFFCLSLTPSLLPAGLDLSGSDRWHQRLHRLCHRRGRRKGPPPHRITFIDEWWPPPKRTLNALKVGHRRRGDRGVRVDAGARGGVATSGIGRDGPREVRQTLGYLRTLVAAVLVGGVCVSTARVLNDVVKFLARKFIRRWHLHQETAMFLSAPRSSSSWSSPSSTACCTTVFCGWQPGVSSRRTPRRGIGISQPARCPRSPAVQRLSRPGTPLGFKGRNFVATGPHGDELTKAERAAGRGADPGVRGPADRRRDKARADVLVRELNAPGRSSARCSSSSRPPAPDGSTRRRKGARTDVQRRHRPGRMQYSYLPSWISFLGDREKSCSPAAR